MLWVYAMTVGGGMKVCQQGLWAAAVRNKLFLCWVVLVLIYCSPLPEGSFSESLRLKLEGSAVIFPACFRVLESCGSWSNGRLQPITLSAERMMHCGLLLSLAVEPAYQMVMELVKDGGVEVHHHWLWQFELLQLLQVVYPMVCTLYLGAEGLYRGAMYWNAWIQLQFSASCDSVYLLFKCTHIEFVRVDRCYSSMELLPQTSNYCSQHLW